MSGADREAVPVTVVGIALAAALLVLLLLSKSRLSQLGFEISGLERELELQEAQRQRLLVTHAQAYSLERIEAYAETVLGMRCPEPDQYQWIDIDIAEPASAEPRETKSAEP